MINATINQFLTKQLPNLKIAVIGDVMVDRYVFGDVSRISPEAPVPVNRVAKMKEVLGGAGNVASNLSNLDCTVYLGAIAGNDDHGRLLQQLLKADKIDTTGLLTSDDRSTITKMRILGDRQQMMRLDFETITDYRSFPISNILMLPALTNSSSPRTKHRKVSKFLSLSMIFAVSFSIFITTISSVSFVIVNLFPLQNRALRCSMRCLLCR